MPFCVINVHLLIYSMINYTLIIEIIIVEYSKVLRGSSFIPLVRNVIVFWLRAYYDNYLMYTASLL